ncbi:MAG: hypothetical protein EOP53_17625 [Sphingobacteriales bacterium]|nr:MAG: hypothetical protein EOP53_17625 [Sphingobacteriales bacterium]
MYQFRGKNKGITEPAVDVTLQILLAANNARPDAVFISSLLQQYRERGGLSKKQLEGLHSKASKIEGISVAHLATLQAIINKKQTRYKSEPSPVQPKETEEDNDAPMMEEILQKYPQHKRVLFFRLKMDKKERLTATEKEELKKFYKLLIKP